MRIPWSNRGSSATPGRRPPRTGSRRWRLLVVPAAGIALTGQLSLTGPAGAATAAHQVGASVAPNLVNELDCNGWSKKYGTVKREAGALCADPVRFVDGEEEGFVDNGWYVGHDEPGIRFLSGTPGSGNTMTYYMKLPVDPAAAPTASGSVTHYGELSLGAWFGLAMCDPDSYPQNPCTPDSDSNISSPSDPDAAGAAVMELQIYPPGYTPFPDAPSCSETRWCASLTIDSLECSFADAFCNPNCIEPVNQAFLQTDGVPTGPPSPQLADLASLLPNAHTLLMSQGDVLQLSLTDPGQGFTATIHDLTTGQTGWMTASANNGFMNTNINTCNGTPFTFHAEFSTAAAGNQVPWAADLVGGPVQAQEIGHSEVCSSLTNQDPVQDAYPGGTSFVDSDVYDTCTGGSEGTMTGMGPCASNGVDIACHHALTQGRYGPTGCPSEYADTGVPCEFADGYCFPEGSRPIQVNGVNAVAWSDDDQCFSDRWQNGNLTFNGVSYQPWAWPDGSPDRPTPFEYVGPFLASGQPYPQIQFETDVSGSAILCHTRSGAGCVIPPISARFYPYWSLSSQSPALGSKLTSCAWNFGGNQPDTVENFGADEQYGPSDVSRYAGTNLGPVMTNPEFAGHCTGASYG
jgi:hypothetical protein